MKDKKTFKQKFSESISSWKRLLKFYKSVKIPWFTVIMVTVLSMAVKEIESMLVPYTTKIQTAQIDTGNFLIYFIIISIAYNSLEAIQGGINELGSAITTKNVRKRVWRKIISIPMSNISRKDPQSFVSRVTNDTTGAYAAITVTVQLIAVLYGIYTNFRKMYRLYHSLALIMLSAIPLTILVSLLVGKMQFKMEKIVNDSVSKLTNFFAERLPNVNHIKISNMEDEEYLKGIEASQEKYKADIRYLNLMIVQGPITTFAQYINEAILLVVASELVRQGIMRMPQLINLYNYFLLFMGNSIMLTAVWQGLKKSHGCCETIAKICDTEDEDLYSGLSLDNNIKDITFKNVDFSYDDMTSVLKDLSFSIPRGKITCLVGENGSGKSTCVKLLERFEKEGSGAILIGDDNINDIRLFDWRSKVGYLFQADHVIKGSIRENLTYGVDREVTDEEIFETLKSCKSYDFVVEKEDGLDTQISRFSKKLSGGQMQRLSIARVLLQRPDYLIMDEATSGIDKDNENDILETIFKAMEGKTVIIITHDINLIKRADNIIVLKDGSCEASGSFDNVNKESSLFKKFVTEGV